MLSIYSIASFFHTRISFKYFLSTFLILFNISFSSNIKAGYSNLEEEYIESFLTKKLEKKITEIFQPAISSDDQTTSRLEKIKLLLRQYLWEGFEQFSTEAVINRRFLPQLLLLVIQFHAYRCEQLLLKQSQSEYQLAWGELQTIFTIIDTLLPKAEQSSNLHRSLSILMPNIHRHQGTLEELLKTFLETKNSEAENTYLINAADVKYPLNHHIIHLKKASSSGPSTEATNVVGSMITITLYFHKPIELCRKIKNAVQNALQAYFEDPAPSIKVLVRVCNSKVRIPKHHIPTYYCSVMTHPLSTKDLKQRKKISLPKGVVQRIPKVWSKTGNPPKEFQISFTSLHPPDYAEYENCHLEQRLDLQYIQHWAFAKMGSAETLEKLQAFVKQSRQVRFAGLPREEYKKANMVDEEYHDSPANSHSAATLEQTTKHANNEVEPEQSDCSDIQLEQPNVQFRITGLPDKAAEEDIGAVPTATTPTEDFSSSKIESTASALMESQEKQDSQVETVISRTEKMEIGIKRKRDWWFKTHESDPKFYREGWPEFRPWKKQKINES